MNGVVSEFEEAVGLGTVTGDDGSQHPFHCTQIADGTRTIEVGSTVRYELRPWHRGRWEAVGIEPR